MHAARELLISARAGRAVIPVAPPKKCWANGSSVWPYSAHFMVRHNSWIRGFWFLLIILLSSTPLLAGEADIKIPPLHQVKFGSLSGLTILYAGLVICVIGILFGLFQYQQTKNLPVHERMGSVSNIIWETCKTYL